MKSSDRNLPGANGPSTGWSDLFAGNAKEALTLELKRKKWLDGSKSRRPCYICSEVEPFLKKITSTTKFVPYGKLMLSLKMTLSAKNVPMLPQNCKKLWFMIDDLNRKIAKVHCKIRESPRSCTKIFDHGRPSSIGGGAPWRGPRRSHRRRCRRSSTSVSNTASKYNSTLQLWIQLCTTIPLSRERMFVDFNFSGPSVQFVTGTCKPSL